MQELEKELESYGAEITKTADENGKITSKAQSKVDEIQAKMEEQAKQINEKKSQILQNNIDILCGKDKETKTKENQKLKSEIEDISSTYKSNGSDIENIITSSRAAVGNNEETIKNIADKSSEALTKAIDANEYAQKAIDKGYEAVTLKTDSDTLTENGYNPYVGSTYTSSSFGSKSSSSSTFGSFNKSGSMNYLTSDVSKDLKAIGLGNSKDSAYTINTGSMFSNNSGWQITFDYQQHIKQGNEAIAKGSKLGESATTIANQVKSIGSKYNFAVDVGSGIEVLANKSYQNTEILDKVDEVAEKHKDNIYGKNIINNAKNEAYASVADKVVAGRKKAEEEAKKAQ